MSRTSKNVPFTLFSKCNNDSSTKDDSDRWESRDILSTTSAYNHNNKTNYCVDPAVMKSCLDGSFTDINVVSSDIHDFDPVPISAFGGNHSVGNETSTFLNLKQMMSTLYQQNRERMLVKPATLVDETPGISATAFSSSVAKPISCSKRNYQQISKDNQYSSNAGDAYPNLAFRDDQSILRPHLHLHHSEQQQQQHSTASSLLLPDMTHRQPTIPTTFSLSSIFDVDFPLTTSLPSSQQDPQRRSSLDLSTGSWSSFIPSSSIDTAKNGIQPLDANVPSVIYSNDPLITYPYRCNDNKMDNNNHTYDFSIMSHNNVMNDISTLFLKNQSDTGNNNRSSSNNTCNTKNNNYWQQNETLSYDNTYHQNVNQVQSVDQGNATHNTYSQPKPTICTTVTPIQFESDPNDDTSNKRKRNDYHQNININNGSRNITSGSSSQNNLLHNTCKLFSKSRIVIETAIHFDPDAICTAIPTYCPIHHHLPDLSNIDTTKNIDSNVVNNSVSILASNDSIQSESQMPSVLTRTTSLGPAGNFYSFPINIALQCDASLDVIDVLIKSNHDVLLKLDGPNQTGSLSIALSTVLNEKNDSQAVEPATTSTAITPSKGRMDEIICMLLNANPACAKVVDRRNNTPLHYLARRNVGDISLETMKLIYSMYPDALLVRNTLGQTPIQVAQKNHTMTESVLEMWSNLSYSEHEWILEHNLMLIDADIDVSTRSCGSLNSDEVSIIQYNKPPRTCGANDRGGCKASMFMNSSSTNDCCSTKLKASTTDKSNISSNTGTTIDSSYCDNDT